MYLPCISQVASLQAAAPAGTQGLTTGVFSGLTLVGNLAPFLIGLAVNQGGDLPDLLSYTVASLYTSSRRSNHVLTTISPPELTIRARRELPVVSMRAHMSTP